MDVSAAMRQRRSARAYLPKSVPRADVEEIIRCAGLAPSAINMQPWEYVIVRGDEKDRLVRRLKKAHAERKVPCGPGTSAPLPDVLRDRRRKASQVMGARIAELGQELDRFIEEGSCSFYGAPVAIIVTMDRVLPKTRCLDLGLSVAYLLLAAEEKGLATCPIGLITAYAEDIADVLDISEEKEIVLGIALGYADVESPVNDARTDRAALDEILLWYE